MDVAVCVLAWWTCGLLATICAMIVDPIDTGDTANDLLTAALASISGPVAFVVVFFWLMGKARSK